MIVRQLSGLFHRVSFAHYGTNEALQSAAGRGALNGVFIEPRPGQWFDLEVDVTRTSLKRVDRSGAPVSAWQLVGVTLLGGRRTEVCASIDIETLEGRTTLRSL